jgi:DNA gyrase subunit A
MLEDIDKNTVDFQPNFDDRLRSRRSCPSKIPNLLVNGSSGIAVGMATNIPPHNLREVAKAVRAPGGQPEATIDDCRRSSRAGLPDRGYIYGAGRDQGGLRERPRRVVMRAGPDRGAGVQGKSQIVVTEIPYQVNKETLQGTSPARAEKKHRGDHRRQGRVGPGRDAAGDRAQARRDPNVVLNQLYKHTAMQSTFGVIMLALDNGAPKVMNLKELLEQFIAHRHDVIIRRTQFDLDRRRPGSTSSRASRSPSTTSTR